MVRFLAPQITHEQRLFVMRDDGVFFGEVSDPQVQRLAELPSRSICLIVPEQLTLACLWCGGLSRGYRPEPKEVLSGCPGLYHSSTFIARQCSPRCADSRPVLVLITWLPMPSCTPTHGQAPPVRTAKTQSGHCWTKTSHLGYLTSARSSFAALRDLAGYGGYHALR